MAWAPWTGVVCVAAACVALMVAAGFVGRARTGDAAPIKSTAAVGWTVLLLAGGIALCTGAWTLGFTMVYGASWVATVPDVAWRAVAGTVFGSLVAAGLIAAGSCYLVGVDDAPLTSGDDRDPTDTAGATASPSSDGGARS